TKYQSENNSMQGLWSKYRGGPDSEAEDVSTALPIATLEKIVTLINTPPAGFHANRKVARMQKQRIKAALAGDGLDWGAAETLAYGTLAAEGVRVRFTGQDSRRGTFSHRHAYIIDTEDGSVVCPINQAASNGGNVEIYNSPLSEAGVLGFEFGYSLDSPDSLVLWEAQFGDFVNSAQVITDQFVFSSEDK